MFVVSIRVNKREREVPELQSILTEFGENITTRLGIHNLDDKRKDGLIIIVYNSEDVDEFVEILNAIKGISVNYMEV